MENHSLDIIERMFDSTVSHTSDKLYKRLHDGKHFVFSSILIGKKLYLSVHEHDLNGMDGYRGKLVVEEETTPLAKNGLNAIDWIKEYKYMRLIDFETRKLDLEK